MRSNFMDNNTESNNQNKNQSLTQSIMNFNVDSQPREDYFTFKTKELLSKSKQQNYEVRNFFGYTSRLENNFGEEESLSNSREEVDNTNYIYNNNHHHIINNNYSNPGQNNIVSRSLSPIERTKEVITNYNPFENNSNSKIKNLPPNEKEAKDVDYNYSRFNEYSQDPRQLCQNNNYNNDNYLNYHCNEALNSNSTPLIYGEYYSQNRYKEDNNNNNTSNITRKTKELMSNFPSVRSSAGLITNRTNNNSNRCNYPLNNVNNYGNLNSNKVRNDFTSKVNKTRIKPSTRSLSKNINNSNSRAKSTTRGNNNNNKSTNKVNSNIQPKKKLNSLEKKKLEELESEQIKLKEMKANKKSLIKQHKENERKLTQLPELTSKVLNAKKNLEDLNDAILVSTKKRDNNQEVIMSLQREIQTLKFNLKNSNRYFTLNFNHDNNNQSTFKEKLDEMNKESVYDEGFKEPQNLRQSLYSASFLPEKN